MKIIKNMKIVSKILHEKLPGYKFDRFDKLFFSTPSNMKMFFIGNKENDIKTLFKHSENDECYYEVLSKNEIYYDNLEK